MFLYWAVIINIVSNYKVVIGLIRENLQTKQISLNIILYRLSLASSSTTTYFLYQQHSGQFLWIWILYSGGKIYSVEKLRKS